MTVRVATAVADADGVELLSSEPPSLVDAGTVALEMAVEGDPTRCLGRWRCSVTTCPLVLRSRSPTGDRRRARRRATGA